MNPKSVRREIVVAYPQIQESHRYVVTRGGYKNFQKLYVGNSHHVARLIMNTVIGAQLS